MGLFSKDSGLFTGPKDSSFKTVVEVRESTQFPDKKKWNWQ
jgi:hypothetical protein